MIKTVTDRRYKTKYVKAKQAQYKYNVDNLDKSEVKFNFGELAEATYPHVDYTMSRKQGSGMVFINCMEKLTMNAPRETPGPCVCRPRSTPASTASRWPPACTCSLRADRGPPALPPCQTGHHRPRCARCSCS